MISNLPIGAEHESHAPYNTYSSYSEDTIYFRVYEDVESENLVQIIEVKIFIDLDNNEVSRECDKPFEILPNQPLGISKEDIERQILFAIKERLIYVDDLGRLHNDWTI